MTDTMTIEFAEVAAAAGFFPGADGRLNLPATQVTADALCKALEIGILPEWVPGTPPLDVILTGAAPVWAHMALAHALHGRARRLTYAAPNAPGGIVIFNHGGPAA